MDKKDNKNMNIDGAHELSALQLNGMKLDDKHTVLTPKKLEGMVGEK